MELSQEIILFMMSMIMILFALQFIDEMVTGRKERMYKNIRNKARKEVRLQKEADQKEKFLMELR